MSSILGTVKGRIANGYQGFAVENFFIFRTKEGTTLSFDAHENIMRVILFPKELMDIAGVCHAVLPAHTQTIDGIHVPPGNVISSKLRGKTSR